MIGSSSKVVISAAEVAHQIGGTVIGNPDVQLNGFKPLHVAGEKDLSFLHLGKYRETALKSNAGAIIVKEGVELANHTLIAVKDATEAYRMGVDLFYPEPPISPGISIHAIVDESAALGVDVEIGPGAVIGAHVTLADGVLVMAGAVIGEGCSVGRKSRIHAGAVLYPGVVVGERVAIQAQRRVGSGRFQLSAFSRWH